MASQIQFVSDAKGTRSRVCIDEQEYRSLLEAVEVQIETVLKLFCALDELGKQMQVAAVFTVINGNFEFWRAHRYGLQSALFMGLGRIFGLGKIVKVESLLRTTNDNLVLFSLAALEKRKWSPGRWPRPDKLDDFLAGATVLTKDHVDSWLLALKKYEAEYQNTLRPIRDKVFGHNSFSYDEAREAFEKTSSPEEMIKFLWELKESLWHALYRGNPHPPREFAAVAEECRIPTRKLLQSLLPLGERS
jgi:AbiU2